MKYTFPRILRIDDLLEAIRGRSEFIVVEREHFNVVSYSVSKATSFDMEDENDLQGALRREARGIIFDKSGNLISRPYHKFFNLNERNETQLNVIDFGADHIVLEKADGSMIRPLVINDELFLATKMGITDIAEAAKKLLSEEQTEWLKKQFAAQKTPLLEYVAPTNRIVVQYAEPKLILTSVRDNLTGEYQLPESAPFDLVDAFGTIQGNIDEYITRQVQMEGREGDVIRFADGHMLKLKNEWYVRIHKNKDVIRSERNILDMIINETLDDKTPFLDETDLKVVRDYEVFFWGLFDAKVVKLEGLVEEARTRCGTDRKRVAREFVPHAVPNKTDARCLFMVLDGRTNVRDFVIEKAKQSLVGKSEKYDDLMTWMKDR